MAEERFTVVHTRAGPGEDLSVEEAMLGAIGARVVRAGRLADEDALIAAVKDADALIVVGEYITERVAAAMPRCQVVVRTGVGYDTLDLPGMTKHGVLAVNLPEIWTDEVANQALALLLAANRRVLELDKSVRAGGWRGFSQAHIGPITGETAGIVGCGRIGTAFARRCLALGMRVLAYDPYLDAPPAGALEVQLVDELDTLLSESDYISIHCLLNDETRHLIGEAQLKRMRPRAVLINTARGAVVDEAALIRALQEGWIGGAGIDAYETEPPKADSPLLTMGNVVLSPHNGFYSDASIARMHRRVSEEIIATLQGGWPDNPLNPELKDHPKHAHRPKP
ncbi:MAG TPA: C-terminal binding protein [Dehalococcoidia bacterium]|nr:C-terminal binding protein [Dehalococcoidia bacterium]